MSLPWAAYCGPWKWSHHFQCISTPHARSPACAYFSLSCTTVYTYFWSTSKDDQTGIRFPLCVSLLSMFCHVCLDVIFPSSSVIVFLIFLLGGSESQRRKQSYVEACFRVLQSHLDFPRMLVPWRIVLLRQNPHLFIAWDAKSFFVISRVGCKIFFC